MTARNDNFSIITPWRKIIHIDMDAFYASVEQRDNPSLRDKPVAVGGSRQRGVVAAASYEARRYGVHSAMPSVTAARKCPRLIFVKPRFEVYRQVSEQIREIFYQYTDLVEPLSLDEAYLDVTHNKQSLALATGIALKIRAEIRQQLNLTASAGISYNKFLAKIASDYQKPDGQFLIHPLHALTFIDKLPIHKFFGIGRVTAGRMLQHGISNGAELRRHELADLVKWFGKSGNYYYHIARGHDDREVTPDRERKSISTESTFDTDLTGAEEIHEHVHQIAEELLRRMEKKNICGRTLTLKVKYADFRQVTRSRSLARCIRDDETLLQLARELTTEILPPPLGIRLLGLGISNLDTPTPTAGVQLTLDF
ncbi:MAG: DNA polymerase IV [Bacteroidales bacterium]|nr:DNA polymerase IV [Bacteroidales bacterium]